MFYQILAQEQFFCNRVCVLGQTKINEAGKGKSVSEKQVERDCRRVLEQIDAKLYAVQVLKGYRSIHCYGLVF